MCLVILYGAGQRRVVRSHNQWVFSLMDLEACSTSFPLKWWVKCCLKFPWHPKLLASSDPLPPEGLWASTSWQRYRCCLWGNPRVEIFTKSVASASLQRIEVMTKLTKHWLLMICISSFWLNMLGLCHTQLSISCFSPRWTVGKTWCGNPETSKQLNLGYFQSMLGNKMTGSNRCIADFYWWRSSMLRINRETNSGLWGKMGKSVVWPFGADWLVRDRPIWKNGGVREPLVEMTFWTAITPVDCN